MRRKVVKYIIPQVFFSLADGRAMYVSPAIANSIRQLDVQPGEHFNICKRWNGMRGRGSKTSWDVWL